MMKPFKRKSRNIFRMFIRIGLFAFFLLIIFLGIFHNQLTRVYKTINLFKPDDIVNNFRTMDKIFETSQVHRGQTVYEFEYELTNLPKTYEYKGETKEISKFIDDTWTTGFIVLRDGKISFEKYYRGDTAATKTISWSVAKSFVSALIGIAVHEGYIADIHQPVTDYVPALYGTGYEGVSIKDVLQMSSGISFNEDYGAFFSDINRMGRAIAFNTSIDDFVSSLKRSRPPGTYNHYVSMDTQVLGMVLREATGKSLTKYLEEKIWKRIGMESDAYWLIDSKGMELAFGGLNAILRDYARFGMLYLNEGVWGGEQIVPKEWVTASVTPDAPHLQPGDNPASSWVLGYGFQWWIPQNPEGDFLAIGVYGQFIYVHPKYRIVIVKSSAYPDYNLDGDEKELESIEVFRAIARSLSQ